MNYKLKGIGLLLFFSIIAFSLQAQKVRLRYVNKLKKNDDKNYFFGGLNGPSCFSSEKIALLIPESKTLRPEKISEAAFNNLTALDHFIHSFYYPESYYQSCTRYGYGRGYLLTIPATFKRPEEGLIMSNRQREVLMENRDSTVLLMEECLMDKVQVGETFKKIIVGLQAVELIPRLIDIIEYQDPFKDPYILTTLCRLMDNGYQPFIESNIRSDLYPNEAESGKHVQANHDSFIPFTHKNYQAIVKLAKKYHREYSNKEWGMVDVPGNVYAIGEKGHAVNPRRKVTIESFSISQYEITNQQFKKFVDYTAYVTLAERNKDAMVFEIGLEEFEWLEDSTANWRFPNGIKAGGIEDKMNHPVTCISYLDALAYCDWAKVRLPTIEEWEVASRGNTKKGKHYFGNDLELIYSHANIWRGTSHKRKSDEEDFVFTAPVGSYAENPFGLYDMYGNVFEFCSNTPDTFENPDLVAATRGGSWWCSFHACGFFNSIDIGMVRKEASFSNNGFRVVANSY